MEQDDGAEFPESPEEAHGLAAEKARRLAKLDALRRAGTDPYPYRFDRTHRWASCARYADLEPGAETEDRSASPGRLMLLPPGQADVRHHAGPHGRAAALPRAA